MRSTTRNAVPIISALLLTAGIGACAGDDPAPDHGSSTEEGAAGSKSAPVIDPGDGGNYVVNLDPAEFGGVIDNPYMPLPVGARWRYEGESDGEVETVEVVVTSERREVMGISAVVVRDTVMVGGEVVEDTFDWFAQDAEGNVWYLGEEVKDYENGQVVGTAGSWEAGVDGAQPGIVMPADPEVGDVYRQEFLPGAAEDMMEIVETGGRVSAPAGDFSAVVTTKDWNPLDPEVIEEKHYAPGVGLVREEKVEGADGFAQLVDYEP